MLGIFRAEAKNKQRRSKGGEIVSVPFFIAINLIAAIILVALFIIGKAKNKGFLTSVSFLITMGMLLAVILLHVSEPESHEYRVVYVKDAEVVMIDDNDGITKRYSLDEVIHGTEKFQIGDQVVVITDKTGKPLYITAASQVAPTPPDTAASPDD